MESDAGGENTGGTREVPLTGRIGQTLLEVAIEGGVHIEHSCGGLCACSTCHVYIESGQSCLNKPQDDELDRVEQAPGLKINSRLSCQCIIEKQDTIVVRVPAWNRNVI